MQTQNNAQPNTFPARLALLIPKLATPHDGELIATRDAIDRLLRSANLDWHDVAAACAPDKTKGVVSTTPTSREWTGACRGRRASFGDLARACRDLDGGRLKPNERIFVADMVRRGFSFTPTPRQADWLAAILSRLERRAAA